METGYPSAAAKHWQVGGISLANVGVRDINFDPLVLPTGIASSDDPLLSASSVVYSRSFTRRSAEPKQPNAGQVEEVIR